MEENTLLKRYLEKNSKTESTSPKKPQAERKPVGRPKLSGKTKHEERNFIWTTADELRYIRNIGKYAEENLSVLSTHRAKLLKLYIEASKNRSWPEQVNGAQCIQEAQKELMKAQERR